MRRNHQTLRSAVPAQSARQASQAPRNLNQKQACRRPHFSAKDATRLILCGKLPPHSIIHGSLTFKDGSNPIFAHGTTIRGNLRLMDCGDKTRLAHHMTVEGVVDFTQTPLTHIPPGFTAVISLDVSDTRIRDFPRDMRVGMLIQYDAGASLSMKRRAAALSAQGVAMATLKLAA